MRQPDKLGAIHLATVMPMLLFRFVLRNLFLHRLRSLLTLAGIVVAILAFCLLRTVVAAWYAGAEATSSTRLVTRNAISLVFPLPLAYFYKIRQVDGVTTVSYANWFAGVYIDEKNFFPQFAIEPESYLKLYPEYLLTEAERTAFLRDRQGCIIGAKLAHEFGWEVGDVVPLQGTIYPGDWSFVVRGIYHGAEPKTDESVLLFHYDYLNERLKQTGAGQPDRTGVFIVGIDDPKRAAEISAMIDARFRNSLAETLTETERAFQLGFVAMTEAILVAIEVVSYVIIVIIMAVMANTMAMNARERTREYATLKALGFRGRHLAVLVYGESLSLATLGAAGGAALSYPAAGALAERFGTLFPVFHIEAETVLHSLIAGLSIGAVAACFPALRAVRIGVAEGLRQIG